MAGTRGVPIDTGPAAEHRPAPGSFEQDIAPRECQLLLQSAGAGRLGVVMDGEPEIFTVSYGLDRSGAIVFQATPGTALAGTLNHRVVFEVDETGVGAPGWSVVVHGVAHQTALASLQFGRRGPPAWMSPTSVTARINPARLTGHTLVARGGER